MSKRLTRNEVVDLMRRRYGVKIKFDLPEPVKDTDPAGEFWHRDGTIHLWQGASILTVLHEVGHYVRWRGRRKIITFLRWAVIPLGFLSFLFFCLDMATEGYFLLFLLWVSTGITVFLIRSNSEKFADNWAEGELVRIIIENSIVEIIDQNRLTKVEFEPKREV